MMNPNNQLPSIPPPMSPASSAQAEDPYGFIFNDKPKKKLSLLPSANSPQQKVLMIIFVVVILFIVGVVLLAIFAGKGGTGTDNLVKATQEQQEIARISSIADKKARDSVAQNLAAVTGTTMYSDQLSLKTYLLSKGKKLSVKDLSFGKDTKNDAVLTEADQTNNFDQVYIALVVRELATYRSTLQSARTSANAKARIIIDASIKNADILLQVKATN